MVSAYHVLQTIYSGPVLHPRLWSHQCGAKLAPHFEYVRVRYRNNALRSFPNFGFNVSGCPVQKPHSLSLSLSLEKPDIFPYVKAVGEGRKLVVDLFVSSMGRPKYHLGQWNYCSCTLLTFYPTALLACRKKVVYCSLVSYHSVCRTRPC